MPLFIHESMPIKSVPAIRGVNLGGWLVLEEWITPELFASLPKSSPSFFHDGCRFTLKTHFGKFVCAEEGGGSEVVADRDESSDFEIFSARVIDGNKVPFFFLPKLRNCLIVLIVSIVADAHSITQRCISFHVNWNSRPSC